MADLLTMRSVFLVLMGLGVTATICRGDEQHSHADTQIEEEAAQTTCPVMEGNKIDPNIYTDYKGKRVFFCCQMCKATFSKNPEKYLAGLPQFAGANGNHEGHEHDDHAYEFSLISLAKPTGIATLSLVGLSVCLGLLRRVRRLKPRRMLKLHKIIGFCALGSGLVHATIILLTH